MTINDWRKHYTPIFVAMNAAYVSNDEEQALLHLRAAREQLNRAIEELEGD